MFNILLHGFARRGELLNCEALYAQLRRTRAEAAQGGGGGGGDDDEVGAGAALAPDVYTFNGLIRAAVQGGRPRRALAYRRLMRKEGVAANVVTVSLLAAAHSASGQPLRGVEEARRLLASGELRRLDRASYGRLLAACAEAGRGRGGDGGGGGGLRAMRRAAAAPLAAVSAEAAAARDQALWLEQTLRADRRARGLLAEPHATFHLIRTLGNAGDFEGARRVFEAAPRPRPELVWSEMLRCCNVCGEPAFASDVLASEAGAQAGITSTKRL